MKHTLRSLLRPSLAREEANVAAAVESGPECMCGHRRSAHVGVSVEPVLTDRHGKPLRLSFFDGPCQVDDCKGCVRTGYLPGDGQSLMSCGNWALFRDPSWPWWLRGLNYVWRVITNTYGRREHPRSERGLRKAIAECERWCEIENRRETEAEMMLDRRKVQVLKDRARHDLKSGRADAEADEMLDALRKEAES